MIKKLRLKFILSIMAILTAIFLVIIILLNVSMVSGGERLAYEKMQLVMEKDGDLSALKPTKFDKPNDGNFFEKKTNIYVVKLDTSTNVGTVISASPDQINWETVANLVGSVLSSEKSKGKIGGQLFLVKDTEYGKLFVFSDGRNEDEMMKRLITTSAWVGGASLVFAFVVSLILSKWAVKPVELAFNKQRQFVADASHELKTPITVINTNAEVLESEIGNNKWLSYIKSEAKHMSGLVTNLLYLTKYDDDELKIEKKKFSLSSALLSATLPFESSAFEQKKNLIIDISPNIMFEGNEFRIKQLAIILLDNAIKNCFEGGDVIFSLKKNEGKIKLTVSNQGEGIPKEEQDKIFERFYRVDKSRNRENGGFGLGLAIAKSIVDGHNGKITVTSISNDWTTFKVIF